MEETPNEQAPFVTTLSHAASDPFRLLVEAVKDYGIFMLDPAGNVSSWNPGAEASNGYKAEEIIGRHFSCLYTEEDVTAGRPQLGLELALEQGRFEEEARRLRKSGEPFWAIVTISSIHDSFGQHVGFANVTRDITERKAAEDELRLSERLNRNLVQHLPYRILVKDQDSVMLYCNAAYARDLGLAPADVIGKTAFAFHPKELAEAYHADDREVMSGGRTQDKIEPYSLGAETRWVHTVKVPYRDEQGAIVGVLVLFDDVTEQKRLEDDLRQAQRLDAIGHLAGGVAHDFNNLLGVITGFGEIAHRRFAPDDPQGEELDQILKAADRAASLTRQLLAFGRKQLLDARVLDLNAVVSELEKMLSRLIGEEFELETRLEPDLGTVRADSGQIEQVLMNLVQNSRDAMPGGGRITIETHKVDLDASYTALHPATRPGPYVLLTVSDTGSGMDAATRARVFEPYFTTKDLGKGTGLGLATVHGIVHQSGGFVWVYSEVGVGTTIKVYLPRLEEPAEVAVERRPEAAVTGGVETVLLVEDEPALRDLLRRVLEGNGYQVLCARDGEEALRTAETHSGPIQILVTDLILPGMTGPQIADRLAALRPGTCVLYISGYSEETVVRQRLVGPGIAFLSKPFRIDSLLRKVRELLDEKG